MNSEALPELLPPRVIELIEKRTAAAAKAGEQDINTTAAGIDAEPLGTNYSSAIRRLIDLYSGVDKSSFSLPAFSLLPLGIFAWSIIKFELAVFCDLLLFIPINSIVLIRNVFPGRWSYKSWSWKYFKYLFLYCWRGECYAPSIFFRPLMTFLLSSHFRRRLLAIRRRLLVEQKISDQIKKDVFLEIDNALNIWQSPTATTILFTYIFPVVAPVMAIWNRLAPSELPWWANFVGYLSVSYAFAILATAFLVKRGLMLGGTGRSAYFPGALEQPGAYAEEGSLLDVFGINMRELPMDIIVYIVLLVIALVSWETQMRISQDIFKFSQDIFKEVNPEILEQGGPSLMNTFYTQFGQNVFAAVLILVAWRRRKTLHRW